MALPPPSPHRPSPYMASSLGHGFPSPSGGGGPSHHPHSQQQQQHAQRPIAGLRSVTGDKRKRAQSEAADEQALADAPVGRLKLERSDSAHGPGGGRGTSTEAEDDEDDEDGGATSLDTLTFETGLSDDDGAGGSDDHEGGKKARPSSGAMVMDANGRKKIQIKYIEDKSRRHITFSKRKAGIMKKAFELSTLTGTQVLLLVVSETGLVYTFTTSKLQPLVTKPEGKNLIQACLNAPTGEAPGGGPSGPGGMTTGNRSRSSTTPGLPIRHKDDTIEYGPEPTAGSLAAAAAAAATTSAPASRKSSASAGPRKPRAPSAKSRKASTVDEGAAAAAVAAGPGGGGGGPAAGAPTTAPPPITNEMLQRREAEVAARRGGSGGDGGQIDPALHPLADHAPPTHAHPHYLNQAFAYGASPSLAHPAPAPQVLLPPYSPRTPQPPPHLAQPYAPLHPHSPYAPPPPQDQHQHQHQQQSHGHQAQQGGPPPSPVHSGGPALAQHHLYLQQQQQQQQAYHHPHLQHPQDFGPPLPHQGYAYAGNQGGQQAGAYGDPTAAAAASLQQQAGSAQEGDTMPGADGAGGHGAVWPSSLYNS